MEQVVDKRSYWPAGIIIFFILLAIFNAVVVWLALKSKSIEIESNPYEAGLKYEDIIQAKNAAVKDNIQAVIDIKNEILSLELHNISTSTIWDIEVRLTRPDNNKLDQLLTTSARGPVFELPISRLKSGLWLTSVTVSASGSSKRFYYFENSKVTTSDDHAPTLQK